MMNLTNIWNTLKDLDGKIGDLYRDYHKTKLARQANVLPGRRSLFMTTTEFSFDCTVVAVGGESNDFTIKCQTLPITKPIVMSNDGVYCISRMSYEAYIELSFDYTSGASVLHRTRRTTLVNTPWGFSTYLITEDVGGGDPDAPSPMFDFEWMLAIGSNDRAYSTDVISNNQNSGNFLSKKSLGGYNNKQLEFAKPYFLDGNEFFTLTIRPTLVPLSNSRLVLGLASIAGLSNVNAKIIVSMVTLGHKILGNGHKI